MLKLLRKNVREEVVLEVLEEKEEKKVKAVQKEAEEPEVVVEELEAKIEKLLVEEILVNLVENALIAKALKEEEEIKY
jgi:C4-dicarboxylate-specific signal transduction histidine kinase